VRAEEIKKSLAADVPTELGHAQRLAKRIRTLGGTVPGSQELHWEQEYLQPPRESTDVVQVIRGVIEAEEQAISTYERIIATCEGNDYVTQDLAIEILADEQGHRREFIGFLKEYENGG
jgi:bacterioferritin